MRYGTKRVYPMAPTPNTSFKRVRTVYRKSIAPGRTGGFYGAVSRLRRGRRMLPELKFIDGTGTVSAHNALAPILVNGVLQGNDYNQRIGRRINVKSIFIRCKVNGSTGLTVTKTPIRVMLIWDMQCNGATPALSDIFSFTGAGITLAMQKLDNRERFRIVMDKVRTCVRDTFTDIIYIKKYMRQNMIVTCSGTSATVGSIATGGLFLILLSDYTLPDAVNIDYNVRTRFIDS